MNEYNILYVDDEQANLNALKSLFRRKFNIITATSGLRGLELLEEHSIQLIIADQRMPLMTGVEFLKKVKDKWPEIKCILLTGFHDNQVIKEAVNEVGIYWYMNKPFENEKLELVISKALESFESEDLLKESEEKFKGVFNSIIDGFIRRDLDGKVVLASPSVFDITGYTNDELIGQNIQIHFTDPKQPELLRQNLLDKGGAQIFESDIIKKDGSIITVSSNAKLYYDDAGKPIGIESVFRDITENKRAEKELKESEEKFKGVFNSLIDVFIRRDFKHKGILVSPSIIEVTGHAAEDIVGQDISKYFVDPQKPDWIIHYLLEKEGIQAIEFELYKKDGTIITVSSNARVYHDNDGNPIGIESVFRDVTDQKIAEEALMESKERYQSLSDASFEAIFISEKGVCLEQNVLAEQMFGYTLSEAIGKLGTEWIVPEDRELVMNNMLSGHEKPYEVTALRKDGSTFSAEIQGRMMNLKGRDVRVTALNNITVRKRAEEALRESEQKFKTLVTQTEEIIYMIAKDGTFLLSEGKGLEKLGLKGGDVVGKSVYDLYKDFPELLDKMELALSGETVIMEHEVGDVFFKSWYTPQLDQKGAIIGLLGMSINTTEQKQAELKVLEYQKRLKDLAIDLTIAEEKMRKQIAIDLHDDVGQLLSASRMQMAAINYEAGTTEIKKKIGIISKGLYQAIQSTRSVIFNLSPPQINEIGLYAAVHDWMNEQIENKYNIRTKLTGNNERYNIDENSRFLIFRSMRELMMNVVKHAKAKHLNINIKRNNRMLEITVQDDGVGFDKYSILTGLKSQAYGLFSIQERMSDLGGSMEINSKQGIGTRVKLLIPLGGE